MQGVDLALREATNHSEKARGNKVFSGGKREVELERGCGRGLGLYPHFRILWSHTWRCWEASKIRGGRRASWCCPRTVHPSPALRGPSAGEGGGGGGT